MPKSSWSSGSDRMKDTGNLIITFVIISSVFYNFTMLDMCQK